MNFEKEREVQAKLKAKRSLPMNLLYGRKRVSMGSKVRGGGSARVI